MRWAGECELVSRSTMRDRDGMARTTEQSTTVACNVMTLSANAYYSAMQAGIKPEAVIQVRACDYHGERRIVFGGRALVVDRAEATPDFVRLTLVEEVADRGVNRP